MKRRTKDFALRVMKVVDALPNTTTGRELGKQLIRSGCSVGANYRAACRGRSRKDFIAKFAIADEEADESVYWLELISARGLVKPNRVTELLDEADQLTAIITASRKTAAMRPGARAANQKSKTTIQKPPRSS